MKKFLVFLLICLLLLQTGCGTAASYEEVYAKAYADAYKDVYNGEPSEPTATARGLRPMIQVSAQ